VSQTSSLLHLQTLESQLDSLRKRSEEIGIQLSQSEAVRIAQARLEEATRNVQHWQSRQKDLEFERDQLQADVKASEERLYSGQIFNPRELTDLQDKIAELNQRRDALENPILEAMLALEDGFAQEQSVRAVLDKVLADQAETLGALTVEQEGVITRIKSLEPQALEARQPISQQNLVLFDRLRQRPGGIAVAILHGEECGGCGVELTSQQAQQVKRGDVVPCPTCGRILHAG
jgi:predicted  nucleic acid-binding Zn-ribbon protein